MRCSLAALSLSLAFACSDDDPPSTEDARVDVSSVGLGTVVSAPAGIDCGGACSTTFPLGTLVELTAQPSSDGVFLGWSGACAGATCSFEVERDVEITATFADAIAPLEVRVEGPGVVESNPSGISCRDHCTHDYRRGDRVVLTATPDPGFRFVGWSGACGEETCTLDMAGKTSVVALFTADPDSTAEVRIQVLGPGLIATDLIDCSGACQLDVPVGTALDFTATPGANARFIGWSDACAGTESVCRVEVNDDLVVTGSFGSIEGYDLTVLKSGNGRGLVTSEDGFIDCGPTCTAAYPAPAMVELIASPEAGSWFEGWTGCVSSASERCTVELTQASTVIAEFGSACNEWSVDVTDGGSIEAQSDPRMDTGTALTIETWLLSIAGFSGELAIRSDEGASECAFALRVSQAQLEWCVYSGCSNGGFDSLCLEAQLIDALPRWRHVAAVFEAPDMLRLYVDGELVNDMPIETGTFAGAIAPITEPFRTSFQSFVASMRMSRVALYSANFAPLVAPPPVDSDVFNWPMEEGMGNTVFDASLSGIDGQLGGASWVANGPVCGP